MDTSNNSAPTTFTVYKASAGSGKTFTLTAEYIAKLLAGENYSFINTKDTSRETKSSHRNILAVTFTNKATTEMKERILQELRNMAFDKSAFEGKGMVRAVVGKLAGVEAETDEELEKILDSLVKRLTQQDRELLRQNARRAMAGILHDYDHFQVSTIDSFFQSLLSNLAHELGLSSGYKVNLDDKDTIAMAVAHLVADPDNHKAVKDWMIEYILERINENKRWDITKDVTGIAGELTSEEFMEREDEIRLRINSGRFVGAYVERLKGMEQEALRLLKGEAEKFRASVPDYSGLCRYTSLDTYIGRLENGIVDEPTDTVWKYIGRGQDGADDVDDMLKKADKGDAAMRAVAVEVRRRLKPLEQLRAKVALTVNSCRLSYRHMRSLRLLGEVDAEVGRILDENNALLLAKTPMLFQKLQESDAAFVFEKAGTDLHHIMIDEFQDTSRMQWGNFERLFSESFANGYRCLLVGDTKQGIYRFRGGDWNILSGIVTHEGAGKWRAKVDDLKVNYRSCCEVVGFNNSFFKAAAKWLDDELGDKSNDIQNIYADVEQKANGRQGGNVEIRVEVKRKEKKEGKKKDSDEVPALEGNAEELPPVERELADKVLELKVRGMDYRQMAVLVRRN